MKFIGKPSDYYDHQAYVWGVDEKIVYNRGPFWEPRPPLFDGGQPVYEDKKFVLNESLYLSFERDGKIWRPSRYLVVCGRLFPLVYAAADGKVYPSGWFWSMYDVEPERRWEIYRADHHTFVPEKNPPRWQAFRNDERFYDWEKPVINMAVGDELPAMEWLSKQVHQPIFVISHLEHSGLYSGRQTTTFTVESHYPVTADMGLGQFLSPDRLYQDVGYWLSNIINPSPDIMPEGKPPQTDIEKVMAHGFDKKKSFRKRKSD